MDISNPSWPLSRQHVIKLLSHYGIQSTQQRVDIAQILFDRPQHLSADQVLASVNESRPSVSKATVYNTLGLFAEKGLVRQVIVDSSRVFYDSNVSDHHHLYNTDTGELTDISTDQVQVLGLPDLADDIAITGVDVIIRVKNTR